VVGEFELLETLQKGACIPIDMDAPEGGLHQTGSAAGEGGERLLEVQRGKVILIFIIIVMIETQRLELRRQGYGGQGGENAVHYLKIVDHELEDTPAWDVGKDKVSDEGQVLR
jgi:hypothetical protein